MARLIRTNHVVVASNGYFQIAVFGPFADETEARAFAAAEAVREPSVDWDVHPLYPIRGRIVGQTAGVVARAGRAR